MAFSGPVEFSSSVERTDSSLLRRQWEHNNTGLGDPHAPETWDVNFAFADNAGRVTSARLESFSRDVLADLDGGQKATRDRPNPKAADETVPWILTLTTDTDRKGRRDIERRHPSLGLLTPPVLQPST